jgi:hypothetical protein
MKKILFSVLTLLLISGLACVSYASVDNTCEAVVLSITGDVMVDEKGTGNWITAEVGMKLKKGAIVMTGENGLAQLVFDADGLNVVLLKQNTQVTVQKDLVDIYDGSVMGDFKGIQKGSEFKIKTPNMVCGIRGTGVGADFFRNTNITNVRSFESSVWIQGTDQNGNPVSEIIEIPEGWQTRIFRDGNVSPPDFINENDRLVWYAWIRGFGSASGQEGNAALAQLGLMFIEAGQDTIDGKDLQDDKDEASKKEGQDEISPS